MSPLDSKKPVVVFLSLLMLTVGLSGCTGNDTEPEPEPEPELADWDVYYVDSGSDLPACGSPTLGRLYYVASTAGFETCTSEGWAFIDLTGPAGPAGTPGSQGPAGEDGNDGADGVDGSQGLAGVDGTDGKTALAATSIESSGSNCTDGGVKIEVGVDDDGNGALDSNEIDFVQYVCNGADGQDGANSSVSPNTMLTSVSSPATSLGCTAGGRVIAQGLDNGNWDGIAQNGVLEEGEVDFTTTYCSAFRIIQLVDFSGQSGTGFHGWAASITPLGTTLYFRADDGVDGSELWAHNTINGQTWQVADIRSGPQAGVPDGIIVMGNTLYFEANDGVDGFELWTHNTINGQTWQVADICASGDGYANDITVVGTAIYFEATDCINGYELWAHETTNGSTWQVADIWTSGNGNGYANDITVVGTTLYFEACGIRGCELYSYDTVTGEGPYRQCDCRGGSSSGYANDITVMGTYVFFNARPTSDSTYYLYAYDTIADRVYRITYGNPSYLSNFAASETNLYFQAYTSSSGYEMHMLEIGHNIHYGTMW